MMASTFLPRRRSRAEADRPNDCRDRVTLGPPTSDTSPEREARRVLALNDGEIAWRIAAEVTDRLSHREKSAVYLTLGCGENHQAIVQILTIARRDGIVLSEGIWDQLSRWLEGYAGTADEPALRDLLRRSALQ